METETAAVYFLKSFHKTSPWWWSLAVTGHKIISKYLVIRITWSRKRVMVYVEKKDKING